MSYLRIDTSLETRQYGFKDGCSRLVELDETFRPPSGYLLAGEPRHDNLSGQAADFDGSIAQERQPADRKDPPRSEEARLRGCRLEQLPPGL